MKTRSIELGEHTGQVFFCPGCKETHVLHVEGPGAIWSWNGSQERPTFTPSILHQSGHYAAPERDRCWCTWNLEHPENPAPFGCHRCHSYVKDGRIQFLSDCTHALAGQTVELPEIAPDA